MASANDYHLEPSGEMQPTLGKDEPSEDRMLAARSKSAARLQKLKDDLEAANAELSVREKKQLAREQATIEKERELELRERALDRAEKAKKGKPAAKADGETEE